MTVMKMAIFIVVNWVLCHLYTQTYRTDTDVHTRRMSSIISFTDQTYLLRHSTKSSDSLPDPIYGTDSGISHASELSAVAATDRHTFLSIAPSWQPRSLRHA